MSSNIIKLEVAGQVTRLDLYLSQQLTTFSRNRLQKLITSGQVIRNGSICTQKKQLVELGDRLEIILTEPQPLELIPQPIPLDILYEDNSLIILNKPAGLVVHPANGHWDSTLVNALLAHCPNLPGISGVIRPGIVHRLDKDTTGAIVVAKTDQAQQHIQAQLKAKTAQRIYKAIVYGVPKEESGTINASIGRHRVDRKKMAIVPVEQGGRIAITHWKIEERLGNYTLMEFKLETGRTHQIRVHCANILNLPIVADPLYGSGKSIGVNLPGQALHAWKLELEHPITHQKITAIAPLPPSFSTLIQILRRRI